jgi:HK97 family phage major capsid protein
MDYEIKADNLDAVFDGAVPAVAVTRPVLSGGKVADPARSAFVDGYLRRGSEVELKSFHGATPADGGFAVPREIDEVIDSVLKSISPIRAISSVVRVGSAGYRKLVTQNGVTSGWAAETAARPETATPTFNEIVPSFGDLYANPAATQAMLDDAAFDVEAWLADEIATEFPPCRLFAGSKRPMARLSGNRASPRGSRIR